MLRDLFLRVIKTGGETVVEDPAYLRLFGLPGRAMPVAEVWRSLFAGCSGLLDAPTRKILETILAEGCLAARILRGLQGDYRRENLRNLYRRLADALRQNSLYLP